MKLKGLLFCVLFIAGVFFFGKIPLDRLFTAAEIAPYAREIKVIIIGTLVIFSCLVAARHQNIQREGGFAGPDRKKYWMLLLPLFFPGLLFITNDRFSCYSLELGFIILVAKMFISSLMEECIFRGVILGYLRKKNPFTSPHILCFSSSVLFALVHLSNARSYELLGVMQQVIYAFYMGLLFSALLFHVKNVWLLGLAHAVLNMITANHCTGKFADEKSISSFSDYLAGIASTILLFSPILFIYWFLMSSYKRQHSVL